MTTGSFQPDLDIIYIIDYTRYVQYHDSFLQYNNDLALYHLQSVLCIYMAGSSVVKRSQFCSSKQHWFWCSNVLVKQLLSFLLQITYKRLSSILASKYDEWSREVRMDTAYYLIRKTGRGVLLENVRFTTNLHTLCSIYILIDRFQNRLKVC